ncbi:MAG: hypothetical protein KGM49_07765 [Sphingomonadales bacterium]|nr:hypothetical protein [Sphingomonadales bacterium]
MDTPPTILATGLVIDRQGQGTTFPSAGGNSANSKVQAVYWRCVVAFFASARLADPHQRLALFCNDEPPTIDGVQITRVLARYGVELRRVPLTTRLSADRTTSWGNALYFHDIMTSLEGEPDSLRLALVDSDVLVTQPLDRLFAMLDRAEFVGYPVETAPDEVVNGMTPREMAVCAGGLVGKPFQPLVHFGGELFATAVGAWKRHSKLFRAILDQAAYGQGPGSGITTEEHVYSIAFALLGNDVATAEGLIKRIWTSPRHNTVQPGDENLPIWHLPAEKRYGLADLFHWLARNDFPVTLPPGQFLEKAKALCGVPTKSPSKWIRDGARQVIAKLPKP